MGTTVSTPGMWPTDLICSRPRASPTAPMIVFSVPRDRWARYPTDSIQSTTRSICPSVAFFFITMIMIALPPMKRAMMAAAVMARE
ncbi:MAG: hypothetical protein A4E67_02586 [Syntrophaceae bacterium PtaB.Bin038]|nr:MAG: hypothetical protein A4E67_02586 [Syntrophaceae bacterium PtaB.Bin038]